MAQTIKFNKVVLDSFTRKGKIGTASFTAQLTDSIIEAMNWEPCPESFTGGDPEGELSAKQADLVPSEKALSMHRCVLSIQTVYKFEIVRRELEGKRGKGHRFDLKFKMDFDDLKGCKKLEQYMLTLAGAEGSLTVQYEKQAELNLEDDKQGKLAEAE